MVSGLVLTASGCGQSEAEVVVTNRMGPAILIRDPSWFGCVWKLVLGFEQSTPVGSCLAGSDRVHFQKLDLERYYRDQAERSALPGTIPPSKSCAILEGNTDGGGPAATEQPSPGQTELDAAITSGAASPDQPSADAVPGFEATDPVSDQTAPLDVDPADSGLELETPLWFNYQTVNRYRVDRGEFRIFNITVDQIEQDFSVPGPYGH